MYAFYCAVPRAALAVARRTYVDLQAERGRIASIYADWDKHPYHTLRTPGKLAVFRPRGLPQAKTLPAFDDVLSAKEGVKVPAQRPMAMMVHHARWLECLAAARAYDEAHPRQRVKNREQVRFISISQEGADGIVTLAPDGSHPTKAPSPDFVIALQRRGGLWISDLLPTIAAARETGNAELAKHDELGDTATDAEGGDCNRQHNMLLNRVRDAVLAVAIGQVVMGDKTQSHLTDQFNKGHIPDIVEIGGDDASGKDNIWEIKTKSSTCPSNAKHAGNGNRKDGGAIASVGHRYGFGNTEEEVRILMFGLKPRGTPGSAPFDHATGVGWIRARPAHEVQYHDALVVKRNVVSPVLVETLGGVAPHSCAALRRLDRRSRGRNALDNTKYGDSRIATTSYYVHHLQRWSLAVVLESARKTRSGINRIKRKVVDHHRGVAAAGGD